MDGIKKVVITGGAGFIGSNLAHYFDENHKDVSVLVVDKFRNNDTFSNGNLKSFGHFKNLLGFNGEIMQGDINCQKTLDTIAEFAPDAIFHQAAISDTTVLEQDEMVRTNVDAFRDLLEICGKIGAKMIYASSAASYGNAKSPQKVGECENPNNAYGFSKLAMDKLGYKYAKIGLNVIGLRYFNVYGKNEFFKGKTASMVLQFGLQILSGQNPRLFEGSGEIKRDFVYIKDVVNANILALKAQSGVYNVATGEARSFESIVDILQDNFKTNLTKEFIKNPYSKSYQFHTQADISQTSKALKYEPQWNLEQGISHYCDHIRQIYENEVKK